MSQRGHRWAGTTFGERFWSKVEFTDTCWLWTGAINNKGYGTTSRNSVKIYAHRAAYEMGRGQIPAGYGIDHICGVPACVKPSHLRLATQKQNMENQRRLRSDNSSGHRGVVWCIRTEMWIARAVHEGVEHYAGRFVDVEEAARAAAELRNSLFTHNDADRIPNA